VPSCANQPTAWVGGQPGGGPGGQRGQAGVLNGVLRDRQVTRGPGDAGDRGPPVRPQLLLEPYPVGGALLGQEATPALDSAAVVAACALPPVSMTARTSTEPAVAAGSIAAKCSAWSKSAHSTRV